MTRLTLLIFLSIQCFAVFSQPTVKTYKGSYPAVGLSNEKGTVEYSYVENPSGGRIYEGPFDLKWGWNNHCYLKGSFKNNKQNGVWEARWNDGRTTTLTMTANFKDGIVDGPVSYKDEYETNTKNIVFLITIECNFAEGKLSGPFSYKYIEGSFKRTLNGNFENNIPIGNWTETSENEHNIYTFTKDDNQSRLYITIKSEDIETGDITENKTYLNFGHTKSIDPRNELPEGFDVISRVISSLGDIILRDSEPRDRRHLELATNKEEEVVVEEVVVEEVYTAVDLMPTFPGGDAALMQYVSSHINYPENGIQGRVIVQFVVTKTGDIGEVKVIRSKAPDLDKEAVRVVKSLPKFNPGRMNGQDVSVWYTLPINFNK